MKLTEATLGQIVAWGAQRVLDREEQDATIDNIEFREVAWFTDGSAVGFVFEEGFAYSELTWQNGFNQGYILEVE